MFGFNENGFRIRPSALVPTEWPLETIPILSVHAHLPGIEFVFPSFLFAICIVLQFSENRSEKQLGDGGLVKGFIENRDGLPQSHSNN